jgi:hypothetical protein
MQKREKIGEVSFVIDWACNELRARKAWQFLFDYYRNNGGDVGKLDNMLIDYTLLCKFFSEYPQSCKSFFEWDFFDCHTSFISNGPLCGADDWLIRGEWDIDGRLVTFYLVTEVPDESGD